MTVYGTYGSSLQQGDIAPRTAANPERSAPPYRSTRPKSATRLRFLDRACHRLLPDQPAVCDDRPGGQRLQDFRRSGQHWLRGHRDRPCDRTAAHVRRIYGGRSHVTQTGNPSDRRQGVRQHSELKSNLLSEYRFYGSTYTSINWQFVGRRPIDDINSTYTPAYNVVDLGARYSRVVGDRS